MHTHSHTYRQKKIRDKKNNDEKKNIRTNVWKLETPSFIIMIFLWSEGRNSTPFPLSSLLFSFLGFISYFFFLLLRFVVLFHFTTFSVAAFLSSVLFAKQINCMTVYIGTWYVCEIYLNCEWAESSNNKSEKLLSKIFYIVHWIVSAVYCWL